jgi:hypothetical protein
MILAPAAALAGPALADTALTAAPAPAASLGHHGQAFAASQGAKARIVEPDGRVIATGGYSDLVAPSSIAEMTARTAIARLIRTEAVAKAVKTAPAPALSKLQQP